MKKNLCLVILCLALLAGVNLVLADDGFYVIGVGGKPVGKEITSLPYPINESGMYYLSRNLTNSTTGGIMVSASNVTIDLMGFTLTGPGTTGNGYCGILIYDTYSGVEVRNGCITNFGGDGVHCLGQNCRFIGLRVNNMGGAGISENGQNQVISCIASKCGHEGIYSGGSSMLKGNTVNGNTWAGINAGASCTVAGNSAQHNSNSGIAAGGGSLVQGNQASGNGQNGISVSTGATVMGNTAFGNKASGIKTDDYCTVIDNSTNGNDWGIQGGNFCTITRNTNNLSVTMGITGGAFCTFANNTTPMLVHGSECTLDNNTIIP